MNSKFNIGDIVTIGIDYYNNTSKLWLGRITKIDNLHYYVDCPISRFIVLFSKKKYKSRYKSTHLMNRDTNKEEIGSNNLFYMRESTLEEKLKSILT